MTKPQRCYITPSAVSRASKRLRSVLNDPLFERQGQLGCPPRRVSA
ncbi:helix-turn-helix domain-containing protein (plasmid) [Pseudoalteromonas espejiana]